MTNIQEISIDKLRIHPKNVRKSYQGISELAASIKEVGILQNLTVVPIPEEDGYYYVVIGNRRLQAAKKAGLQTVPCTITEMEESDQALTMLTENLQRNDLTILEEANGYQMCFSDFGIDVNTLAKKTGFSKTTVRHRLNVAKLDQDVLQKKIDDPSFQLSFTDIQQLEKVRSIEKRNEILDKAENAQNLSWLVLQAVNDENCLRRTNKLISLAKKESILEATDEVVSEQYYASRWTLLRSLYKSDTIPEHLIEEGDHEKYPDGIYYISTANCFKVLARRPDAKPPVVPAAEEGKESEDSTNASVDSVSSADGNTTGGAGSAVGTGSITGTESSADTNSPADVYSPAGAGSTSEANISDGTAFPSGTGSTADMVGGTANHPDTVTSSTPPCHAEETSSKSATSGLTNNAAPVHENRNANAAARVMVSEVHIPSREERMAEDRQTRLAHYEELSHYIQEELTDFCHHLIDGKVDAPDDVEEYLTYCWNVLMNCATHVSNRTVAAAMLNRQAYAISAYEISTLKYQIQMLPVYVQMLAIIRQNLFDCRLMNSDAEYVKDNSVLLREFYALLNQLGFSFSDEALENVMNGTHDIYQPLDLDALEENADSENPVMSDVKGTEEDVVADTKEDVVADAKEDVIADAEEDVVADAKEAMVAEAGKDVASEGEEDVVSDVEEDVISDVEEACDSQIDYAKDVETSTVSSARKLGTSEAADIRDTEPDASTVTCSEDHDIPETDRSEADTASGFPDSEDEFDLCKDSAVA